MSVLGRRVVAGVACLGLVVPVGATGVAAGATKLHSYPPSYVKAFEASCAKTAKAVAGKKLTKAKAESYCHSTLVCIEGKLTLEQFKQAAAKMQTGQANPNAKVLTTCEKQAVKKLK